MYWVSKASLGYHGTAFIYNDRADEIHRRAGNLRPALSELKPDFHSPAAAFPDKIGNRTHENEK